MSRRTRDTTGPANGPQGASQRPATATPGTRPRRSSMRGTAPEGGVIDRLVPGDALLSVVQVCAELGVARSTYYEWRAKRKTPREFQLPNREYRIRRSDLNSWLESRIAGDE